MIKDRHQTQKEVIDKMQTKQDHILNFLNNMETKEEIIKKEERMEAERKNERNKLLTRINKKRQRI